MSDEVHSGGCFCGAIRYQARGAPVRVSSCHCSDCRRSSGAPFLTFATFPRDSVAFTEGKPKAHRSSARAERWFCPDCGTLLAWSAIEGRDTIDLTVGGMDEPDGFAPEFHLFTRSRVNWLKLDDGLPQHETWP
ncbi:MAG: GFA family protein [Alphaproteobacteria bacterium]|nr:GFA family protein [Alphaproteobacteria bacterium]